MVLGLLASIFGSNAGSSRHRISPEGVQLLFYLGKDSDQRITKFCNMQVAMCHVNSTRLG